LFLTAAAVRNLFCSRSRARAFRARDSWRLKNFAVSESGVCFKVAIRLFVRLLDMTAANEGRGAAGINKKLMEKSAAAGMKLIREPSQVGSSPTSVGFATSAHAKCAFIVLQKIRGIFRC
jgi:hypothetical protein